ncbi:hypothetical protein B0H11DRAFT_2231499 [Mycena galericulata]|nr:hypothetical protein B0H11DRAFT_2231499 [Mycena galericulata]
MESIPFCRKSTWYGCLGLSATRPIPKSTLPHIRQSYASVIYRVFRKEVCGQCFAYSFDARGNAWNIKFEAGSGIWFEAYLHLHEWIRSENAVINAAVDKPAKIMDKRAAGKTVPVRLELLLVKPMTQEIIDLAWAAVETRSASLPTDALQPTAPLLNSWVDLLGLQNNELPFIQGRSRPLDSRLSCASTPLCTTSSARFPLLRSETVRAVCARDQWNVSGMYEMSQEEDEMFGGRVYASASSFNHGKSHLTVRRTSAKIELGARN